MISGVPSLSVGVDRRAAVAVVVVLPSVGGLVGRDSDGSTCDSSWREGREPSEGGALHDPSEGA